MSDISEEDLKAARRAERESIVYARLEETLREDWGLAPRVVSGIIDAFREYVEALRDPEEQG